MGMKRRNGYSYLHMLLLILVIAGVLALYFLIGEAASAHPIHWNGQPILRIFFPLSMLILVPIVLVRFLRMKSMPSPYFIGATLIIASITFLWFVGPQFGTANPIAMIIEMPACVIPLILLFFGSYIFTYNLAYNEKRPHWVKMTLSSMDVAGGKTKAFFRAGLRTGFMPMYHRTVRKSEKTLFAPGRKYWVNITSLGINPRNRATSLDSLRRDDFILWEQGSPHGGRNAHSE